LDETHRMTAQRKVIMEELLKVTSHPTADELYLMVRRRLPSISLGTVYRNLEILSRIGLIKKLDMGGPQKRYDGNVSGHQHVRCTRCGTVADIDVKPSDLLKNILSIPLDFEIMDYHMEFIGLCGKCRTASKRLTPRRQK
jgi:Fur family transcriptional regulator, ferric uptake regulator